MEMPGSGKVEFNYSFLLGFIKDNPSIRTLKNFAGQIGVSEQELSKKLKSEHVFTQRQIITIKSRYGLSPEEVSLFFFTPRLKK